MVLKTATAYRLGRSRRHGGDWKRKAFLKTRITRDRAAAGVTTRTLTACWVAMWLLNRDVHAYTYTHTHTHEQSNEITDGLALTALMCSVSVRLKLNSECRHLCCFFFSLRQNLTLYPHHTPSSHNFSYRVQAHYRGPPPQASLIDASKNVLKHWEQRALERKSTSRWD